MTCELCNFCSETDCKLLVGWSIIAERLNSRLKWKLAQANSQLYRVMSNQSQSELNSIRRKYTQNKDL